MIIWTRLFQPLRFAGAASHTKKTVHQIRFEMHSLCHFICGRFSACLRQRKTSCTPQLETSDLLTSCASSWLCGCTAAGLIAFMPASFCKWRLQWVHVPELPWGDPSLGNSPFTHSLTTEQVLALLGRSRCVGGRVRYKRSIDECIRVIPGSARCLWQDFHFFVLERNPRHTLPWRACGFR